MQKYSMSYNIVPLETYRVKDPRTKLNAERKFAVLEGGQTVSWKNFTTNSFSTSSMQFTTPPPSPGVIIDRKVYVRLGFRLTFTGTTTVADASLLQGGFDSLRAFPISSIIQTLNVSVNNNSASINMADVIHALLRYNTGYDVRDIEYSMTPAMLDQSQEYAALQGGTRNPLALYADNEAEIPRGGFPMTIVQNDAPAVPGAATAIVDVILTEPIFLSPLLFGFGDFPGFIGVQTMDWNFTFISNLARLWSHALTVAPFTGSSSLINSIAVEYTQQPSLLFTYITPKEIQSIPRSISYSFYDTQRYPTNFGGNVAADELVTFQSNNIQLQSIPRRIYLFVRRNNSELFGFSAQQYTDTFFSIETISVNWNNRSGLLSSASKQDLYNISKKNGLSMSWTEWSGGYVNDVGFDSSVDNRLGTVGSVLCLCMGTDIGLESSECPGMLGTYQLQINMQVRNVSKTTMVNPTFYIVVVNEGTWTVMDNRSLSQIGVVSHKDVLDAAARPELDPVVLDAYYGGNFWSGLKGFGEKLIKGAETVAPYVSKAADVAGPLLPLLALAAGEKKGKRGKKGGAIVGGVDKDTNKNFLGGRQMREQTMLDRLMH